jgi:hypothetical protein
MKYSVLEGEDLVGADTQSAGTTAAGVDRFGLRQDASQLLRRAALAKKIILDRPFVNFSDLDFEAYSGAGEQMTTGLALRGKDQPVARVPQPGDALHWEFFSSLGDELQSMFPE